jgi:hypothetical protein
MCLAEAGAAQALRPVPLLALVLFLAACGAPSWRQDPAVRAARSACKGVDEPARFACIESHAVGALNPDVCRLAGIYIDDACLQSVYEAAGDPAVCDRLYLEGVRPTCRAYYAALDPTPLPSPAPLR